MKQAENTKIWRSLAERYKKNQIGYRFMKKPHAKNGWGQIVRRIETVLLLPFIPLLNWLAIRETERIQKKKLIFYIRSREVRFYLPDVGIRNGDFIQNQIYLEQDYFDIDQLMEIRKYIKPGAVILDIGTNIGNHAIFFAKECQAAKVYCFEPTKKTFGILKRNIQINHLEDVLDAKNIALGDQDTKADVICVDEKNCGGNRVNKNSDGEVEMEMLDHISIPEKIDFIKIDVEGFEYEVLAGGTAVIAEHKPLIYVEIFDQNYDKVNRLFTSMGYVCMKSWRHDYMYRFKNKQDS